MNTPNGWDVYLKIKEINNKDGNEKPQISVDNLAHELGIKKEVIREYITALAVLNFIEFTDRSKEVFVMTDLGKS